MGYPRPRPKHLAEKLFQIRFSLGLSQKQIAKRLGLEGQIRYTAISKYENNYNEPPLVTLLAYSPLAGIPLEQIVDDSKELP